MGELSVGVAVEFGDVRHSQCPQQGGDGDSSRGIDRIDHDPEPSGGYSGFIYCRQSENHFYMAFDAFAVRGYLPQVVHFGVCIVVRFGHPEHFGPLCGVEEFPGTVEEFQGIPLFRVVAGGKDDASVCLMENDHHFHRRGRR